MILERLKNLQKFNFDDWYNLFLGLDKRQQLLTSVLLVFVFLVLLWLPTHFLSARIAGRAEQYQLYLDEARQLRQVLNDYGALQGTLSGKRSGSANEDDLSGLIYNLAEEFGIPKKKVNIKSVKLTPGELFEQAGKDVEIKTVPYDQLMRLVGSIQDNKDYPIVIKKLQFKIDRKNRQVISEASFSVSTIKSRKP